MARASTLGKLRGDLADIQKPTILQKLNRSLGKVALDLVQSGFDRRTDPYGVPWRPTRGRNPILERTGTMRGAIRMTAKAGKITVRTTGKSSKYAVHHQYGTRYLPARKIMPDPGALPPAYNLALQEESRRFLEQRFNMKRRR
ncbi:phage virion morphogenesis protein [Deinococcus arenicola]|uniref:Phage virion morphogenesis protein n=1 Tax=Deinococcus arenicola TaxID=2994950 RepID=A0ABU4DVA0_9DEIO|nr:phage virion morphogenesis protein [Deinococcus sp. ZS9-10]MDV6376373.1 phage virion morphogenesis protein [Deinococcus sp. ZS9-10]